MRLRPRAAALAAASLCAAAAAQTPDNNSSLPEIKTRAAHTRDIELPPDKPLTVIDERAIEQRQAENIFDILKDVPGVGVAGGPRSSGMRFTLRGFTDNEDVLFKIDGAVKGFEKYRFGGGVFLEPELLKSLSVERGPSVTSGSGALGGTISASTKSAADLLAPGQRVGAMAKLGYNENNSERLRMLAAYGRPTDRIDLLAAVVRRDSDDVRLADKTRLPLSATHSESRLFKLGVFPLEHLLLELGHTTQQSGPERTPYDATGGRAGVGGVVRRATDDATTHLRLLYAPGDGIEWRGMLAKERTHLHDRHVAGESLICVNTLKPTLPGAVPYCDDYWRYDIWNGELFGDLRYRLGPVDGLLTLGVQALHNSREVSRISANAVLNESRWPNGFNGDQPPGDKDSGALIIENPLTWNQWTLTPGARWDRYTVTAQGGTRENMQREGQATEISFSKLQPSLALTWRIPDSAFSLTGRYNQAFRPPLIDQYFRDGSGNSAGQSGLCMRTYGDPGVPGKVVTAGTIQPLYDPAGIGKPYDPARDLAPLTGICGDLYRPQESVNRELTLAWSPRPTRDGAWQARLTHFRTHTTRLLGSLRWVQGRVAQPGEEDRQGTELELNYSGRRWFGGLSHAHVTRRGRDDATLGKPSIESTQVPGDTTVLNLGLRALDGRLEAGWRWRRIGDRPAYAAGAPASCIGTPDSDGEATQHGVQLQELFASWQLMPSTLLRASVDNLGNRSYCLNSSFSGGVGFYAPGRAFKVAITVKY